MFTTSNYISLIIMVIVGLAGPSILAIWWLKKHKESFGTVAVGAAVWFLFAILLESIPKIILLTPMTSIGQSISQNTILFTIIGASLAGIFEETGRFLAFKTVLKKKRNREVSVTYGIGHGGFEALYVLVLTGIEYFVFAVLINMGQWQSILDSAASQNVDIASLEALPAQIAAITPLHVGIAIFERIFAILLHIGLSMLVFYSIKKRKTWMFGLAILMHALFDIPAALYQVGILNLYVTEAIIAVYATTFFVLVYKTLYQKDTEDSKILTQTDLQMRLDFKE